MQRHPHPHVLQLDIQGTPQSWLTLEEAATHVATGAVAWVAGDGPLARLRGGFNVALGRQSVLEVHAILALRGTARINLWAAEPAFSRSKLFHRDRHTCAYCGCILPARELSCDHIVPQAKGGRWTWMNIVAACKPCNARKADRTPERARMPLLYLPYVPSRYEDFLLQGRAIRADVHDWLAARLPRNSRLH